MVENVNKFKSKAKAWLSSSRWKLHVKFILTALRCILKIINYNLFITVKHFHKTSVNSD